MKVPILVPNIFDHPFTYESGGIDVKLGDYVLIPFGKSKITGVVWNEFERENKKKFLIKKVISKLNIPSLNKNTINFLNWFSQYNLIPKGMALKLLLLSSEAIGDVELKEFKKFELKTKRKKFSLTDEQANALNNLNSEIDKFRVHVLQGTTGSGKTIVYFESIKTIIDQGFQSLIMLPEIGLTKQFEEKFREFFGYCPAIWHSGITKKNKKIIWNGISKGKIKVVIGARSSLFLPFKNLGLIIVDEEHDQSYKQDEGVIYNARDMAISRAYFQNIPINLITAVPSIETFENIKSKKYKISKILNRFKNASLPNYKIIDLNKSKLLPKSWISQDVIEKVKKHLKKNDQVLFFLNRRGFAPFVFCKKCLKNFICPNCSINLVYHKHKKNLLCHYCGYKGNLRRKCNDNDTCDFIFSGPGVERISEELKKIFPNQKHFIFSSDTMNKKKSSKILEKIVDNKISILVGTQLISKGFHFPNLNCIVVVDIDLSSQGHDLRGAEKNLQLYHQLSGRAGRTGKSATVYFQTYNLNKDMIVDITNKNPDIFLEKELEIRKKNNLPPFQRFISLILLSNNEKKLQKNSLEFKNYINSKLNFQVLGPVNAPIYKIRKKFRVRLLIRGEKSLKIQNSLSLAIKNFKFEKGIKLSVDVDPISFN
ncbi:MAG TPA: primosomal protein N' [Candidatus Pelagibacter bacterium]|jgi:primosomal protein N' (replication factor Y)|nr:primosomal protein N' [Candidatus Pelagibacter bacterium]|tara:strand:- start:733 stop:2691 length:1959 start_codon:yes stop_codon:yes gene_type:complete